jgi:hypothetical protein
VKAGALPVFAWAAFLTLLAGMLLVWAPHSELEWGVFGLAALVTWLIGIVVQLRRRASAAAHVTPRSGAGVLAAAGVVCAGNGLVFGWWLAAVGAGLVACGVALFVREAR